MTSTCDICKETIKDLSIDITIGMTTFDENGDPVKTMQSATSELKCDQDYVTVCINCTDKVKNLWYKFLDGLEM